MIRRNGMMMTCLHGFVPRAAAGMSFRGGSDCAERPVRKVGWNFATKLDLPAGANHRGAKPRKADKQPRFENGEVGNRPKVERRYPGRNDNCAITLERVASPCPLAEGRRLLSPARQAGDTPRPTRGMVSSKGCQRKFIARIRGSLRQTVGGALALMATIHF